MWEGPFDKACRYLLKLDPAAILAWLLGIKLIDMVFIRWIDTRRLPYPGQPDRTCDTVAHVERLDDNHRPWAIITEFNIEPDAIMFGRLLGYLGPLWIEEKPSKERGDRFEIGAIVVNLTGIGASSRTSVWPSAGMETRLLIRERNLADMKAADVLSQIAEGAAPRSLLPWIPLMHGGNESAMIKKWKEIAVGEPQSSHRTDFAALAIVFASTVKKQEDWRGALKEWNMIESSVVKEWQEEGRTDGRRLALLEVLAEKFGSLPPDVPAHIKSIDDSNILRTLLQKALHVGSLDDFRKQIPNGNPNGSSHGSP